MGIDYNSQANYYEETRSIEPIVYSILSYMLALQKGDVVLDFGSGTGNYIKKLLWIMT